MFYREWCQGRRCVLPTQVHAAYDVNMTSEHKTEIAQHADDCLTNTSSSAAPCSCGAEKARRIAERDAWQNGMEVVEMTQQEVDDLLEYSTTLPTGKTIGKRWKRYLHLGPKAGSWVLCEYVEDPDPAYVGIKSQLVRVSTSPGEVTS